MMDWGLYRSRWRDWPVRVGVKVIEEEPEPVIPLDVCRQHLEIVPIDGDSDSESHPDDLNILGALAAAVDYAEDVTGLCIVERVLEMGLDSFPRAWGNQVAGIAMKKPPVVEILSFTGADGSEGELDPGDHFTLDDYQNPPQLLPVGSWPTVTRSANQIKIRYRAGYRRDRVAGDSDDPVSESETDAKPLPRSIRMALLLLLGHFFENRSDSVEKALATIPIGATMLLGTKRIETGFA